MGPEGATNRASTSGVIAVTLETISSPQILVDGEVEDMSSFIGCQAGLGQGTR